MEYRELEYLVIKWADSRGIFEKGNPTAQALKTVEEADELVDAIDKQDREEVVDAL
jgi:NTP pyrophosphatase (non-canonical NTP hydrolase)